VLFTAISLLVGNGNSMPADLETFIGNFTTIHLSYNGAWWYLLTYALIIFTSPVLLNLSGNKSCHKTLLLLILMSIVYCISYYERFRINSANWFIYQFGLYGMMNIPMVSD
jgi:hypothetical protein